MNISDAATSLRCSEAVVTKLIEQGLLPTIGGEVRRHDVEQFLRSSRMASVARIRREVANDELAEVAKEQAMEEKKLRLVEKLEVAVSEGDFETARLCKSTLEFLNEE